MNNILQKLSALALMTFAVIAASAQRPAITVSTVAVAPGGEQMVSVYMDDDADDGVYSFEAYVTLPRGFAFVKDGSNYAAAGSRSTSSHTMMAPSVTTESGVQTMRVALTEMTGNKTPFGTNTNEPVVTFKIKAPDSFGNTVSIELDRIVLLRGSGAAYRGTADSPYTAKGTIMNSSAPHAAISFESLDTLELHKGDSVEVRLNASWPNELSVKSGQGSVTLPDGLSFAGGSNPIAFNSDRFSGITVQQSVHGQTVNWVVLSIVSDIPNTPEEFATLIVKADSEFDGIKNIQATYELSTSSATLAGKGEITRAVAVTSTIPPSISLAVDTLNLVEGDIANIVVNVSVPAENAPTVSGVVTLPECLSFPEGSDGTFSIVADKDTVIAVPVVAGKANDGNGMIVVEVNSGEGTAVYDAFKDTVVVSIAAPVAPSLMVALDTLELVEGGYDDIALMVTVPKNTTPTIAGMIILPEGLSFVDAADSAFKIEALVTDTVLTVAVMADKAYEGHRNVLVSAVATSACGTVYDAYNGVIAAVVTLPKSPVIAFDSADTLQLEEEANASLAVSLTVPEGTTVGRIDGTISLPVGIGFDDDAESYVAGDGVSVSANGRKATWTVENPVVGTLFVINIKSKKGFADGAVKIVATPYTAAGTRLADQESERLVANKTAAGISHIIAEGIVNSKDVVYNLRGQRISKPSQGIYIVNGKKVIFK